MLISKIPASKSPEIKVYDPDLALVDRVRKSPTSRQSPSGAQQQKISFVPYKPGKYVICAVEDKVAVDDTPFSVRLNLFMNLMHLIFRLKSRKPSTWRSCTFTVQGLAPMYSQVRPQALR
jgi:hypothetical protein